MLPPLYFLPAGCGGIALGLGSGEREAEVRREGDWDTVRRRD